MTEKYHEMDPMSDVISDDYRMLQMIGRFGITLGFGNQTVGATCRAAGVDVTTFLTVVNYVKDAAHAHIGEMVDQINLPCLIRYLKNSHTYFVDFRLPNIRRKLLEAIDCSSSNQIGLLILRFYDEYAAEVARHMEYENSFVHPFVENLLNGKVRVETFDMVVRQHEDNHASLEKSIAELKSIIIKYYPSDNAAQLMGEVLMDIYMTEEDLLTHCHMEDTLFAECVRRLECKVRRAGGSDINSVEEEEEEKDTTLANDLSEREKDIVVQVAKGLSNKEIADALFISVNTVMTHRRNISRKLQIHSPAALAIYALVNGLVNLDEIVPLSNSPR
ncbi:MAG: helix-turn-helix transcriptional regulator [Bacteroidaceae bacterium]|nr:helix-turn-helix transcriptional regulator [Bacteroidaceae bacterium]